MKKTLTILLAAVLCLSLVACGGGDNGPDKQPAIDAYNELVENYNKFVNISNEDLSDWSQEEIDYMNSIADVITEYGNQLDGDTEFTQEQLDEIVDACNEFNGILEEYLADEG